MKILLYTYDIMKIGGIETSFFNLAPYLKSKGYEVGVRYTIIAPMQLQRYKEAGIDIKRQQPETCDVLFVGSVWRRPKQIRAKLVVQQVHADWSDKFWGEAESGRKLIESSSQESDVFVPVSKSAASFVSKYTDKPVIVMNNLAPTKTSIDGRNNKKLTIAAFTRMTNEKGLKNYEALRDRLKELKIDVDLRVYTNGDAPDGWELYEPVPDIRTELPDIDFVANLSDTESFGYTIAEANSCGVPCIIKRANSTGEFFDEGSNIILDTIDDLDKKSLRRKIKVDYKLRKQSEQSIDKALKQLEKLSRKKTVLKSMRTFYDMEAKKQRLAGELFTVSSTRAKELSANKIRLVQVL